MESRPNRALASMEVRVCWAMLRIWLWSALSLGALTLGQAAAGQHLPLETTFRGRAKFERMEEKARSERWDRLALGDRVVRAGRELEGTPYKGFTLEIHDRIESPSVNLEGMDCWTFFETALGFARMLEHPRSDYGPEDLLREVEQTRYRDGVCHGNYLDRIHYLAEWYVDNERRGNLKDLTHDLGGIRFVNRRCTEMTTLWRSYRYLRNNPSLREPMARLEARISKLPMEYVPTSQVKGIEGKLRNGDVIGIASKYQGGFCSHVGLAYRAPDGTTRLMHASSDAKRVIVDSPVHIYLKRYDKHAGILVGRPLPPPKPNAARTRAARG
ncbi:MAG TPA: N-acetylmuramoyl-L-alanine amidase-like domain-containing protein [Verrucomicrobiales bacterium]|nr:N-acetylmuramoyl-L-alanine amidase-like domain-containing protein [Verrucomicrobiales bacterium]